jgi:hypothetical protein
MIADVLLVMAALMVATVGQWIFFDQTAPFFKAFDYHTKHEWVGRIAGAIAQLGIILCWFLEGGTSVWGQSLLIGYTLHDILHMLVYETDITSYIHHIVSATVFGLLKLTMTPEQTESTALATVILESTSPVLSVTWLLKNAGFSGHPLFKYMSGFAAAFFGIMRCGVFPWAMAKKMDRTTALVLIPFLVLNIYWFWKIIKMVKKVLETKAEPASSSEQSHES